MALFSRLRIPSTMEIFRSIRTIRFDWIYKSVQQQWCYMYGVGRAFFVLPRLPLFEQDQRVHWFSYFGLVYVAGYAILIIFTAFVSHGELTEALPCTCLYCPIVAYAKFIWAVISKNRERYHSLVEFGGRYIYRDDNEKTEYNRICAETMRITVKRFLIKAALMVASAYISAAGPIYAFFFLNYKTSTTELKFPFIQEHSDAEFISKPFAPVYNPISWNFFTPKLVQHELRQLIDEYVRNEISGAQLRLKFKNLEKKSIDYDNYIASIKEFLYVRSLITPSVFTYEIAMAVFCHMKMQFIAGYGMASMSFVQLFFICDFGECIENNGLADALYDTDWTSLPLDVQKDLSILINRYQNAAKFTEGPFRIINRELFKIIANKVYVFIMFLRDFTA